LHRADDITRPDSIVFDLDPGEGTNLVDCGEIAFLLKDLLADLNLQSVAKVSGSKGLQLYVPLNNHVTYSESRSFAESVAQMMERQHPGRVVSRMAKELRKGKVFIDWSQNSDFKTTVGVYSLRANADTPFVSAPVSWDELTELVEQRKLESLRFSPSDVLKRVEKMGDLFAPIRELKQKLPSPRALVTPPATQKQAAPAQKKAKDDISHLDDLPSAKAKFIEPMLLMRTSKLPEGPDWQYEIKLDGYRALAIQTSRGIQLRSRNDNDFAGRYPQIATALKPLPPDTVVDGEIVAIDEDGRPSFNHLQNHGSSKAPLLYYVFDLLVTKGRTSWVSHSSVAGTC
jgi:ATP-dependent DNA ligase